MIQIIAHSEHCSVSGLMILTFAELLDKMNDKTQSQIIPLVDQDRRITAIVDLSKIIYIEKRAY